MTNIFADWADHYWNAGLPVIPLKPRDKMPLIKNWSEYSLKLPDQETREIWKSEQAGGNIGLCLGVQSGLVALDVDAEDLETQNLIYSLVPKSPWERIGAKGKVLLYRYTGQPSFRLKTAEGKTLCELLSNRLQIVLPPSIHPKTQAPYVQNRDLVEVLGEIPILPKDIESVLRAGFEAAGIQLSSGGRQTIMDFVPAGSRDTKMVAMAGLFARGVLRGERTLLEALDEMQAWINTRIEKVWGDEIDGSKGKQKLVEFLLRDVLGPRKQSLPVGWDVGLTEDMKSGLGLNVIGEGQVKKSVDEIIAYYQGEMGKEGVKPGDSVTVNAVDRVVMMIAGNPDIRPLDQDRILKFISETSGRNFTVSSMKREIGRLQKGDIQGNDHTEIAKAVIDDMNQLGEVRYWNGLFYQYQGAHWEELSEGVLLKTIAENYGQYPAAKRASDHSGIVRVMQSLCRKELKTSGLVGINFVNGYLTQELKLLPHSADFGCQYVLPYPYLPDTASKAYQFHEMLMTFWGQDEDYTDKVEALREAMAVTLFGVAPLYQKAFLLFGVPSSGKSRILELLKGIMPEGCYSTIHPSDFNDKFAPAQMVGKLLNIGGDLSERTKIEGGRFKEIVEGAEVEAQHKNKPLFRFRPMCAQWFASNHGIKTTDTSNGFFRRWLILRFDHVVPPEKRRIDLVESILSEEREAIVAWAVQGMMSLMSRKGLQFTEPSSHTYAIEQMAQENNAIRFFIQTRRAEGTVMFGEKETAGDISVHDFHSEFSKFCLITQGVSHVSLQTMKTMLRELQSEFGFRYVIETKSNGSILEKLRFFTFATTKKAAA